MGREMRKKARVSYFEPEEPSFDEYVFCTCCGDYVYEYCSIHGPLLVIPDDQIFDSEHRPSHVIDARDPNSSNWMRYVNCSRHYSEQNLVAFQFQGQLFYRTIRIVPRFTELLVFYGSEFASELNIDLRRYHSPVYTETLVKCADLTMVDDATQPNEASTVSIDDMQNLETVSNCDNQYTSESNSLIIELDDSEEENVTSESQTLILNFDLSKQNVDTNKKQDTHKLKTHIVNNNLKKPKYVCSICHVRFTSNSDYINHDIKIHNSNIRYCACTLCDYKTVKSSSLKEHIERHSEIKQKCELCDYVIASSRTLKRHIKEQHQAKTDRNVKEGENTYSCTVCGNTYQTNEHLKRHIRIHDQEKIHICMICNKRFDKQYALKRHMTSHNQERPHTCAICNKCFRESRVLKRHLETHRILNEDSKNDVC